VTVGAGMGSAGAGGLAARPQLIRAMNEQLLLEHIRRNGELSRADLARISGLSKPTVSLALSNLERAGLVQPAGVRTGVPGPAAVLYEVRPDAGFVLALDVGQQFLRGAVSDLSGTVRASSSVKAVASTAHGRVAELVALSESLFASVGIAADDVTQTVLGSPGVYDPRRDVLALSGSLPGWDKPSVLAELRRCFGAGLMVENDVDAAALAERAHGHGRDVDSFAFVSIGTGIGMGLVLGGRLHRGAHGAAGEIGYLPVDEGQGNDPKDARKRGGLEAAASAAGIVRAARKAGMSGPVSARLVFEAADRGDDRASTVVAEEAVLVAKAICSVIAVVDPELIVLGGGIGQAPGFLDDVAREVRKLAPVLPELRVSALGATAVVDGCLAAGAENAWKLVTAEIPPTASAATRSG
jgi:predicted NBD/HSP70 family sugar kinase